MTRTVVSDSTALIALSDIHSLQVLQRLYGTILVPRAVYDEVVTNGRSRAVVEVANASWIKLVEVQSPNVVKAFQTQLDLGESEAMTLAIETHADLLIVDERLARRAAKRLGQNIIGVIGILVLAKTEGLIPEVRPLLDWLTRLNFQYSSALRQWALEQAREADRGSKP